MNSSDDASEARGCPAEYPAQLEARRVAAAKLIDQAIRLCLPGARHEDAPQLFDDRVSSHTVRAWRNGWRGVPQWAIDVAKLELEAHGAPYLEAARLANGASPGIGCGWNKGAAVGLGAWRAAGKPSRPRDPNPSN